LGGFPSSEQVLHPRPRGRLRTSVLCFTKEYLWHWTGIMTQGCDISTPAQTAASRPGCLLVQLTYPCPSVPWVKTTKRAYRLHRWRGFHPSSSLQLTWFHMSKAFARALGSFTTCPSVGTGDAVFPGHCDAESYRLAEVNRRRGREGAGIKQALFPPHGRPNNKALT
jgi:hypothetical protein